MRVRRYVKEAGDRRIALIHAGSDLFLRNCYVSKNYHSRISVFSSSGTFRGDQLCSPNVPRKRTIHGAGAVCDAGDDNLPPMGRSRADSIEALETVHDIAGPASGYGMCGGKATWGREEGGAELLRVDDHPMISQSMAVCGLGVAKSRRTPAKIVENPRK